MQDLRFAFRQLLKSPGFALVAVTTLALGIGGNTAMFTVVDSLLLKPLPWPESHRVVSVWETNLRKNVPQAPMAAAQFVDLRRDAKSFEALAAWNPAAVNLAANGSTPERHPGALVTEDFFKVVGVRPALGAGFATEHFVPGKGDVTLISQSVWLQRFAGDPEIIGRTLVMNGRSRTIVGVMPAGFQSPAKAAFWVPRAFAAEELEDRDYKAQYVLGRLAPGVRLEAAAAELETLFAALRRQYPDVLEGWAPHLHPALEDLVKPLRPAMLILVGAVAIVLGMACLNVASLLLARGAARRGELGIRAALGAGRRRLAQQALWESLAIALPGALVGLVLAVGLLRLLLAIAPATLPRIEQVRLDSTALLFTAAAVVVTTLLAGLAPALHQANAEPLDALRLASSRSTSRLGGWRRGLIAVQVAAAVVVLVTTSLLLQSFDRLLHRDVGFDPNQLLTVRLELPPAKYAAEHRRDQFAESVIERLVSVPGIESAAATTYLPLQGWPQFIMRLEENPIVRPSDASATGYTGVTPDYFRTLGMRLLQGRGLTTGDREDTVPVCVVNQAFARTHFGARDPIGKRLEVGFADPPNWLEIVGVVNDTQNAQMETQPKEQVFVPFRQQPAFLRGNPAISVVLRSKVPLEGVSASLRSAIWAVDRDQPLHLLQPMTQVLDNTMAARRFIVTVLGLFALVALLLAAIGLYGVMTGYVASHTREIGVRMALGAPRGAVVRRVLQIGAGTLLSGIGLGALGAIAAGRLIRSQLFATDVLDLPTWLIALGTLAAVGLLSCIGPAARASRVDPIRVLRTE